nr:TPA_inf: conotoxin precursor T [Conus judaeus]
MRCLPVFIILLLLVPSAHSIVAQSRTNYGVPQASFHGNAKAAQSRRTVLFPCCPEYEWCCTWMDW